MPLAKVPRVILSIPTRLLITFAVCQETVLVVFCSTYFLAWISNEPCELSGLWMLPLCCVRLDFWPFLTVQNNSGDFYITKTNFAWCSFVQNENFNGILTVICQSKKEFCMKLQLWGNTRNWARCHGQAYICACVHCSVTAQSQEHAQTQVEKKFHSSEILWGQDLTDSSKINQD